MTTDERHLSGYKPSQRRPQPGELLFEFTHAGDRYRCELRNFDDSGIEAQIFQAGELLTAVRFTARVLAVRWAEQKRAQIERGAIVQP